ncbi:MAG: YraN family protein [Bosea sp. (in: a-proteobacteria)]
MRPMRSAGQQKAGRTGKLAEHVAALFLMAKGYRILARRYGGKGGEIDLIAKRGDTIAFVEVKARDTMEAALGAITSEKQRLVARRVRSWQAQNPWANGLSLRADAVFIAPWCWPRHIVAIFELV